MSPTSYQLLYPATSNNELLFRTSDLRVMSLTVSGYLVGAGDRGRTDTIGEDRGILSPVRLPIPPLRQKIPQAAYSSLRNGEIGSGGETRTHNLAVNSRLLRH